MRENNFDSATKNALRNGCNQYAFIFFQGGTVTRSTSKSNGTYSYDGFDTTVSNGVETLTCVSNGRLMEGGLVIDDDLFPYDDWELGATNASEIGINLCNFDQAFSGFDLVGSTVKVYVNNTGVKPETTYPANTISFGMFVITDSQINYGTITLTGYDISVSKLSALYSTSLTLPATLGSLLSEICTNCGIFNESTSFTNSTISIKSIPTGVKTYRDMVRWISQIAGGFAKIRQASFLDQSLIMSIVSPSKSETGIEIIGRDDIFGETMVNGETVVNGIRAVCKYDGIGEVRTQGSPPQFVIDNPLLDSEIINTSDWGTTMISIMNNIYDAIFTASGSTKTFRFVPVGLSTKPVIWVSPLDKIGFVDCYGHTRLTTVTHTQYVLNGLYTVECKGQTGARITYGG